MTNDPDPVMWLAFLVVTLVVLGIAIWAVADLFTP